MCHLRLASWLCDRPAQSTAMEQRRRGAPSVLPTQPCFRGSTPGFMSCGTFGSSSSTHGSLHVENIKREAAQSTGGKTGWLPSPGCWWCPPGCSAHRWMGACACAASFSSILRRYRQKGAAYIPCFHNSKPAVTTNGTLSFVSQSPLQGLSLAIHLGLFSWRGWGFCMGPRM